MRLIFVVLHSYIHEIFLQQIFSDLQYSVFQYLSTIIHKIDDSHSTSVAFSAINLTFWSGAGSTEIVYPSIGMQNFFTPILSIAFL